MTLWEFLSDNQAWGALYMLLIIVCIAISPVEIKIKVGMDDDKSDKS